MSPFSLFHMGLAIPKIQKRVDELKQFAVDDITDRYDPRIDALEKKIDDTLYGYLE